MAHGYELTPQMKNTAITVLRRKAASVYLPHAGKSRSLKEADSPADFSELFQAHMS